MHDIWNPWHGCHKCSEGCENCYMFFLDAQRGKDGSEIYRTKAGFRYPLSKDRQGYYKIKSGEMIRVCMTSDFFLEEADEWREEAWDIMRQRPDVKFFLLTKRPERVKDHLPEDWGDGWENIFFNVTAENQKRADERIPILLSLPFKHKGIMCAPFVGLSPSRSIFPPEFDITFVFCTTGRRFIKDGKLYKIEKGSVQSEQAYKSGLSFRGRQFPYKLTDLFGNDIPEKDLYVPYFGERCQKCGMRLTCNGCSQCGRCHPVYTGVKR